MPHYEAIIKKHNNINPSSIRAILSTRNQEDYFYPNGLQIYSGRQGRGKTISAVHALRELKKRYPKAIVVTNLKVKFDDSIHISVRAESESICTSIVSAFNNGSLNPAKHYVRFSTVSELSACFTHINNGYMGVIYVVDEIHLYFNSLDSKNIPVSVMTEVSQQRKQRKLIIGTSQLFSRLAKPFREQADNIIICVTYFGLITKQMVFDGETLTEDSRGQLVGQRKKVGWFFHTLRLRESFDTFQKVISSSDQYVPMQTTTLTEAPKKIRGYKKAG